MRLLTNQKESLPPAVSVRPWRSFHPQSKFRLARSVSGRLSCGMCRMPGLGLVFALLYFFAVPNSPAQGAGSAHPANLSLAQIVSGMQSRNQSRDAQLGPYHALRTYSVVYHGLGTLSAQMQVELSYDPHSGKSFRVISQSGPFLLRDAVLKRAVTSEEEASRNKSSTALSPSNYRFVLHGTDKLNGRPVYILSVDPRKPEKFLYRGTIWVDAKDFGVVQIQASPAKNPSMWISGTTIWVTNELTDGFWLPEETRSQTRVRLGGTAMLTIDYGHYQFEKAALTVPHGPPTATNSVAKRAAQNREAALR